MKRSTIVGVAGGIVAGAGASVLALSSLSWADHSPAVIAPAVSQQAAVQAVGQARWGTLPNLADLVEQASPSVVQIVARTPTQGGPTQFANPFEGSPLEEFFNRNFPNPGAAPGEQRDRVGSGSGFFIDTAGHIVTNNHVVENARAVTIVLENGREIDAEVVGTDPKTDLAVLKVNARELPKPLKWGDSDAARPGDSIFAVGSPFGLGNTVTAGIVSARGRAIGGQYDDFIQVDAPINRGNSGGPLFDAKGEVIGVNSAIFSPSGGNVGIGFSIPADLAQSIVDQIIKTGTVERGWLGVSIQAVDGDIAASLGLGSARGALVQDVTAESPADKAGLEIGDLILTFGGERISDLTDLTRAVADTPVGDARDIRILRNGKERTLKATIAKLEDGEPAERQLASARGSANVTADVKIEALGLDLANQSGVVVANVRTNSPSDVAGLRPGDRVLMVNQTEITSTASVRTAVDAARKDKREAVLFQIERNGRKAFVGVPFGD